MKSWKDRKDWIVLSVFVGSWIVVTSYTLVRLAAMHAAWQPPPIA